MNSTVIFNTSVSQVNFTSNRILKEQQLIDFFNDKNNQILYKDRSFFEQIEKFYKIFVGIFLKNFKNKDEEIIRESMEDIGRFFGEV